MNFFGKPNGNQFQPRLGNVFENRQPQPSFSNGQAFPQWQGSHQTPTQPRQPVNAQSWQAPSNGQQNTLWGMFNPQRNWQPRQPGSSYGGGMNWNGGDPNFDESQSNWWGL